MLTLYKSITNDGSPASTEYSSDTIVGWQKKLGALQESTNRKNITTILSENISRLAQEGNQNVATNISCKYEIMGHFPKALKVTRENPFFLNLISHALHSK